MQQQRALDYLNNPSDGTLSEQAKGANRAWNRKRARAAAEKGVFMNAVLQPKSVGGQIKSVPEYKTLNALATKVFPGRNDLYAVSWIDARNFAKVFGADATGLDAAYPNGAYPVFMYGTLPEIISALNALGFFPPGTNDAQLQQIIGTYLIQPGFLYKGPARGDKVQLTQAGADSPAGAYLRAVLGTESKVKRVEAREKREWDLKTLDKVLQIAANLSSSNVIDVNGENIGLYGGTLKKPVENIFSNRLDELEKSTTPAEVNKHVFNISAYSGADATVSSTNKRPDTVRVGAKRQPIRFTLVHGDNRYTPGFVVSDNTAALTLLVGEMKVVGPKQGKRYAFVDEAGNDVTLDRLVSDLSGLLAEAKKHAPVRGAAPAELIEAAWSS